MGYLVFYRVVFLYEIFLSLRFTFLRSIFLIEKNLT